MHTDPTLSVTKKMGNIQIVTPLDTITIRTENKNFLEQQVIEALAECYERGVKQVDVINALNALK
jgi:hypothetical protein